MKHARQIAIIPARGGSKRLPRKNILPINGRPVIAYPITAALRSNLFDDVVVSTEDDEIEQIAGHYGATVIKRPESLAGDSIPVVDVCSHVLGMREYEAVECFCCIYATAVFLKPGDLAGARELMEIEPKADYIMGVSTYNYHPVQALREEKGYLKSMWPEYLGAKSQDYPDLVVSNGTLYWARKDSFLKDRSFYGERLKGYRVSAVDIDTEADYREALRIAADLTPGTAVSDST